MPIYEYQCDVCGRESEETRAMLARKAEAACDRGDCPGVMRLRMSVPAVAHVAGGTGAQAGDRA